VLYRLKIAYKRIGLHLHSPDEHYPAKLTAIQHWLTLYKPSKRVVLFQDECSIYSKASSSSDWQARREEPRAELGLKAQQSFRIAATLDPYSGKVVYLLGNQFRRWAMVAFYQHLAKQYAGCQIYLIQDKLPWSQPTCPLLHAYRLVGHNGLLNTNRSTSTYPFTPNPYPHMPLG
jgi:hypothetical protein